MSDKNPQNSTDSGISPKQMRAIPIILGARTITDGCKAAKIGRDTFYLWMSDDDFKAEYRRQEKAIIEEAFHELKAGIGESVKVLRSLLGARNENVRLKAAQGILDNVTKIIELQELEGRIEALERSGNGKRAW
jgi:hypothetical protein